MKTNIMLAVLIVIGVINLLAVLSTQDLINQGQGAVDYYMTGLSEICSD